MSDSGTPEQLPPPPSLKRSTLIMAAGTLTSRILGFVRSALLIAAIGVNASAASAFGVANKLPNMVFAVLAAGVINAIFVPQIVRAFSREGGKRTVDRMLTLGATLTLGLSIVLTLAAPFIVRIFADGWSPEMISLATAFAYWCIPQLFFYAIYALLGQVLNARSQFGPFMWAPVANNIVAITGLIVYLSVFGRYAGGPTGESLSEIWTPGRIALIGGVATLGIAVQALVLLIPLVRGGFRWKFVWRGPKGELQGIGAIGAWALGAVAIEQIGVVLVMRVVSGAGGFGEPEVAGPLAYDTALMLYQVPHSLVTVSIVTAVFTRLSRAAAEDKYEEMRNLVSSALRRIGVFTVISALLLMVLAPQVVRIIAPTAMPEEVEAVATVLRALSLGLIPFGAMVLIKQVYYALGDAKAVFWIHIPMTLVVVGIAYAARANMDPRWWVPMVGLGMVASNLVGLGLRARGLKSRLGGMDFGRIAVTHLKAILAALPGVLIAAWIAHLGPDVVNSQGRGATFSALLIVGICGTIASLSYLTLAKVLKLDEVTSLVSPLIRRFRRVG